MTALVALGLASLATYAIRIGSVRAFARREMPPFAGRALRYAALGIMASLVITTLPASNALGGIGAASAAGLAASTVMAQRAASTAFVMLAGVAAHSLTGALVP